MHRAVTAPLQHQVVTAVDQTVQHAFSHHGICEQAVPVGGLSIGRDEPGALLLPLTDPCEEIFGHLDGQFSQAEVIDDEPIERQIIADAPFEGTVGVTSREILKQVAGIPIGDAELLLARRIAQRLDQMGLSVM